MLNTLIFHCLIHREAASTQPLLINTLSNSMESSEHGIFGSIGYDANYERTCYQLHGCSNTPRRPLYLATTLHKPKPPKHAQCTQNETKCVRAFVWRTGIKCDQSLMSCYRVNTSNRNVQTRCSLSRHT